MTIKELYEWAVNHNAENYDIEIRYRNGSGYLYTTSTLYESDIEIDRLHEEVTL